MRKLTLISSFIISILVIFAAFLAGCCPDCAVQKAEADSEVKSMSVIIQTGHEEIIIIAEAADTDQKRKAGLMNRTYLADSAGMLFIFGEPGRYGFWMKDTLIPLDMIFISRDGSGNLIIIDIIEEAQPCLSEPCEVYRPSEKADHVLEVNAGFVQLNNITAGDTVIIKPE